ncbi:DNA-binding response regulator [Plantactinospora sp. BC1]|nr:DNA-binding response regulator [Plantactinospora sp. BC1]
MRVAIVESCEIYLHGLVAALSEAGMTVVEARGSFSGTTEPSADVVIIGAESAVEPGLEEATARIARTTPVLVLTARDSTSTVERRLAGIVGVLDRDAAVEVLLDAIRAVGEGSRPPSTAGTRPAGSAAEDDTSVAVAGRGVLSVREYEVLRRIAEGRTQRQIARAFGISHHTVDSYVRRIRAKLGLGNKAELTRAAVLGHLTPDTRRPDQSDSSQPCPSR